MTKASGVELEASSQEETQLDVRVEAVQWLAEGVVSLELVSVESRPLPAWEPGAHIDVVLPSGLRRQYSLCGDPSDRSKYRIAIRREQSGRGGSREIHSTAMCGQILSVTAPRNRFQLQPASSYLFIAGGIGVTALLSMARQSSEQNIPWRMLYVGRSLDHMAFIDELVSVGRGRVDIVTTDEMPRPDLAALLRESGPSNEVYACGPASMLDAISALADADPTVRVHIERFEAGAGTPPPPDPTNGATALSVELARTGITVEVPSDRTVLEVVRDVIPSVPFSCEEGFCGACEVGVVEGMPLHLDDVLNDQQKNSNNVMMICVSRAVGTRLSLDL